jgi:histidinol-phosphate aminotransferase
MASLDFVPKNIQSIQVSKSKPLDEIEREVGMRVVNLASNENPLGPSPFAVDAMRGYLERVDPYPDDSAYYLRQRLAGRFQVSMDQIIIGAGSSDLIAMAYRAVSAPDSEVLTSEGSFIVYYSLAQIHGVPIVTIPLREFAYDLDAMAERLSPKTRLILIANPNNPTGSLIRKRELSDFMKKVPQHALVVFDEAYFEFVSDPDYADSFDHLREGARVLITRTFSKVYGLAGLRIGYAFSTPEIIDTLHKVRMTFNTSSVAQIAAVAALDDQIHVARTINSNRMEKEFLCRELSARGLSYRPSVANFILFDLERPAQEVYAAMLKLGVLLRPMAAWGFPTMVRVTVGTREQNEKFLAALDQIR